MSAKFYQAKRILSEEKKAGTLINAAGRRAVQSVLLMDNGTVIASCFTMNRILGNIAKANSKYPENITQPKSNKVKLYIADVEAIGAEQQSMFDENKNIDEIIANTVTDNEGSDGDEDDYDNDGIVLDEEVPEE